MNQQQITGEQLLDAFTMPLPEAKELQATLEQAGYEQVVALSFPDAVRESDFTDMAREITREKCHATTALSLGNLVVAPIVVTDQAASRVRRFVGVWQSASSTEAAGGQVAPPHQTVQTEAVA